MLQKETYIPFQERIGVLLKDKSKSKTFMSLLSAHGKYSSYFEDDLFLF